MDVDNEKFSIDIDNNATISDDEVVASYGPPRSLLDATTHLETRLCPSVGPLVRRSVRPSRVIFERQKLWILKIESPQMIN